MGESFLAPDNLLLAVALQPLLWLAFSVAAAVIVTWWILNARQRPSRQKLARMQLQSATIVRLSLSSATPGDLKMSLRDVTESAARALGAQYASVWLIDEVSGELRCAAEFDAAAMAHNEGMVLGAAQAAPYLQSLALHRSIVCPDILGDARMTEFSKSYLIPRRITSALDAAVRVGSKLA